LNHRGFMNYLGLNAESECRTNRFLQYDFGGEKRHIFLATGMRSRVMKLALDFANANKLSRIGFTPFARGRYARAISELLSHRGEFPRDVCLFHLNEKDYSEVYSYQELDDSEKH
jgi:hypothetical protein